MIIEDGKGKGFSAAVNKENKLLVSSITSSIEHYTNHNLGRAYNLLFSVTPTGAGDCFLYLKNGDPDRNIGLEGFYLKLAADDYVDFVMNPIGTPLNGTTITPANLNSGSGYSAQGIFEEGSDITGLSGGTLVSRIWHANSAATVFINFDQDMFLSYNSVLALYIGTGAVALDGMLSFNYHETQN